MLSYRHVFYAGNFVDVHKHISLRMLLRSLCKKKAAFCYIDTHAGAGCYDLQSSYAQKNREFDNGITRLLSAEDPPTAVKDYLDVVTSVNRAKQGDVNDLRYYPGSPLFARPLLRDHDRMILNELHNAEASLLRAEFKGDKQVRVSHGDAFVCLKANLPPRERRGLILIDPPYEAKNEFRVMITSLVKAWQKWPTGIYAVWYPLQQNQPIQEFHYELRAAGVRKVFFHELSIFPESKPNRLAGSGLLIINPPWQFDKQITKVLAWLADQLNQGASQPYRSEWLVPE